MLDWLYRTDEDERQRVAYLCRELEEETHHQQAVRERAQDYIAALVRTAVEEHAQLTPAVLRSLADLLERGGATAAQEVTDGERASPPSEHGSARQPRE